MVVAIQSRGRDFGERRFSEASKYVSRAWMPIQSPIVKGIKKKLASNSYVDNPAGLIADLKEDLALFALCLRELGAKVPADARNKDPLALIGLLPAREVIGLLGGSEEPTSSHDFIGIKEVQLLRLKHQLISCSTAQLIGEKQGISGNTAFTAALLRQLGLALVAWNYPSTCAKAHANVAAARPGAPADFQSELRSLLGFDPIRLGIDCLASWNSNPAMLIALGIPAAQDPEFDCTPDERELGTKIAEACEIGEALARANDHTFYPEAAKNWDELESRINGYLGDDGLERIRCHVGSAFGHYLGFAPHVLGAPLSPAENLDVVNKKYSDQLLKANDHVRRCPEPVRIEFKDVYRSMRRDSISTDALNGLVGKIIPVTGFLRGCIYLLDSKRLMLIPRLKFGPGEARVYRPISCACGSGPSHPVAEAFHCSMPIIEENIFLNGDVVSHVTGKFGNSEKIGVLHLEMTDALREVSADQRLLFFKAIRQCLNDCLNLKGRP